MKDIFYQKYLKYKKKYNNLKQNRVNQLGGSDSKKEVFLFKADWCPHCQGFLPSWDKLKENNKEKYDFVIYDGEKNKDKINEWGVQGFPTIMVKKGDSAYEYLGPNSYEPVLEFIENI